MKSVILFLLTSLSCMADGTPTFRQSLEAVLENALKNDFEYRRIEKDVIRQKKEWTKTKLAYLPEAAWSSNFEEGDQFLSNSLSVNWNIFDGWQTTFTRYLGRADLEIQKTLLTQRKRLVERNTGRDFFNWINLRKQAEVQTQEVEFRRSSLDVMKQRFRRGLVAEAEVLKVNVDLLTSLTREEDFLRRIRNAEREFKDRFGTDLNTLKHIEFAAPEFKTVALDALIKEAQAGDYDVQLLKLRRKRAKVVRRQAWANVYAPSLDGSLSYDNNSGSGQNGHAYEYDTTVGVSLTIPLFSQWADQTNYRQRKIDEEKAVLTLQERKRDLGFEMRQLMINYESLKRRIEFLEKNREFALKFYQQSLKRFKLGLATANDMAQDQQRLTQTLTSLYDLYEEYHTLVLDLNLRLGRPVARPF